MRIGVALGQTLSYDDVLNATRMAEELGLDSVWVTEGWGADSLVSVASLAAGTEKVKLAPRGKLRSPRIDIVLELICRSTCGG